MSTKAQRCLWWTTRVFPETWCQVANLPLSPTAREAAARRHTTRDSRHAGRGVRDFRAWPGHRPATPRASGKGRGWRVRAEDRKSRGHDAGRSLRRDVARNDVFCRQRGKDKHRRSEPPRRNRPCGDVHASVYVRPRHSATATKARPSRAMSPLRHELDADLSPGGENPQTWGSGETESSPRAHEGLITSTALARFE